MVTLEGVNSLSPTIYKSEAGRRILELEREIEKLH